MQGRIQVNKIEARVTIGEMAIGQPAWGYFHLADITAKPYGNEGKVRYTACLGDSTGRMDAVDFEGRLSSTPKALYWKVAGTVGEYPKGSGKKQLVISQAREVTDGDAEHGFHITNMHLKSKRNIIDLWTTLNSIQESLGKFVIQVWDCILCYKIVDSKSSHNISVRLNSHPAAQKMHHACIGGLLEHIVSMLGIGVDIADHYDLDRDILLTGIFCHDLGKILEIGPLPGDAYTRRGIQEGHISMGVEIYRDATKSLVSEDARLFHNEVSHLILSHHGTKEHGSPVTPATREAWALHLIDMIDSRMKMFEEGTAEESKPVHVYGLGMCIPPTLEDTTLR